MIYSSYPENRTIIIARAIEPRTFIELSIYMYIYMLAGWRLIRPGDAFIYEIKRRMEEGAYENDGRLERN